MQNQKLWNKDFILASLSNLFQFITFYALLSTLPMFVLNSLNGDNKQAGLVITLFSIGSILLRPFVGKWLVHFETKKVLLLGLLLFTVISFSYFWATNVFILLFVRLLHGMAYGVASSATATIATNASPEHRQGEAVGYYALFMILAMVVGPFIGLNIISYFSYYVLFSVCTIFAILSLFLGSLVRSSKSELKKVEERKGKASNWRDFIETATIPVGLMAAILAFAYAGVPTFIPIYAKELGMASVSSYFFVIYAVSIILSRPFVGKLYDRKGANYVVYPSVLVFIIGMIILSQVHTTLAFLSAGAITGLGFGALQPAFQTLAVQSVKAERKGLATSTFFLFNDLGVALGSFTLGVVSSHTTYSIVYIVCAAVMILIYVLYYFLHHRKSTIKEKVSTM